MRDYMLEWLKKHKACEEGIAWYKNQPKKDLRSLYKSIINDDSANLDWASWYIVHKLPKLKKIQYAVYAAKQVIEIFEQQHPNDPRPRRAIMAAEKYIKNPSKKNANAADAAARAATDAAYAANRMDILKKCADIVRQYYKAPKLERS